jgi:regulator of sigma E protease
MAGEQPGDKNADDPQAFLAKPRWQRLTIALAGPLMNVVLAVALLTGLFMFKFPKPVKTDVVATVGHVLADSPAAKAGVLEGDKIVRIGASADPTWDDITITELSSANRPLAVVLERNGQRIPVTVVPVLSERMGIGYAGWSQEAEIQVAEVSPGMPAEKAGMRPGDLILSVNRKPVRSLYGFHDVIRESGGKPIELDLIRGGKRISLSIQPVFPQLEKRWMIGVLPDRRVVYSKLSFPDALYQSVNQNIRGAGLIYDVLKGIVARRMSAKSIDGPIRIAQLSGDAARDGAYTYINLMAAVSLNLAIVNLLPIPILDGGVVLLLLFEMLIRRDLSMPVKEVVFKFGFVFLLMVMVFVIYNDIAKMLPAG